MRVLVAEHGDDCFGIDSWASGRTTGEAGAVFSILGVIMRCFCDYAGSNGLDGGAVSRSGGAVFVIPIARSLDADLCSFCLIRTNSASHHGFF